jgi:DNA (cytosine-5)-methyltransferase 1
VRAPESPQILRRLTVRERASLQGFPVSYKFFSNSYAQKLKMVGNAIPPLMVFYIAQAMQGISPKSLMQPSAAISRFRPSLENPPATPPEGEGQTYPSSRSFRAAIAGLRFKSGVRFEISNAFGPEKDVRWRVRFYFGNSKDIRECTLDKALLGKCRQRVIGHDGWAHIDSDLTHLLSFVEKINAQSLQDTWSHRREGVSPFDLVDEAGDAAQRVLLQLEKLKIPTAKIETFVVDVLGLNAKARKKSKGDYSRKVRRFAMAIFSGFIVGATLNLALEQNRFSTRKMTRQERLVA